MERAAQTTHSSLARLQAGLTLFTLALVMAAVVWWWPRSPGVAVAVAGAVLGGYAAVLAAEMVLAARWNRTDPAPRAGWGMWVRAWWTEVRLAPQVFAWRQPFRWRTLPDSTAPQSDRPWVVLVHGFVCNRGFWLPWMKTLRARGQPYVSVNLEPVFGSIDEYVPCVDEAVQRAYRLSGRPVVLVCHSMGGLAARAWAVTQRDLGARVQRIVTIGTPHRGTWLGRFSRVANGRQMRLDSEWLIRLEQQERERRPVEPYGRFTCWYSNADNIVMPASTACLPGADNRLLPGWPHVGMAFASTVLEAVGAELDAQAQPDAARAKR